MRSMCQYTQNSTWYLDTTKYRYLVLLSAYIPVKVKICRGTIFLLACLFAQIIPSVRRMSDALVVPFCHSLHIPVLLLAEDTSRQYDNHRGIPVFVGSTGSLACRTLRVVPGCLPGIAY